MQNHYIRSKNSSVDKLVNELESIVYNNIPDDELISEDKLMIFVENEIRKEYGSKRFSLKEIRSTVKNIVDKKIVKEVVGPKLSRFVYSQ